MKGGLTVTPSFTDVTATEGTDYDENTAGLSFTGNANETQTFTVSTTQDSVVEGSETFTVGLAVSGTTLTGSITSTDTGTGTINAGTGSNLDTATLTIDDASASEGDDITFTVTLSEAVQGRPDGDAQLYGRDRHRRHRLRREHDRADLHRRQG